LGNVYTCHGFFQRTHEFEEIDSRTIFYKLVERFVNKRFGNVWQLVLNKIHETLKTIICNYRQVSMGAIKIKEQNIKTPNELSDDRANFKTTKGVQ
jgi:hypothetical protein